MNKTIFGAVGFLLGAAAGAVGSWYILKKRYEQIAQEEIDSVKEVLLKDRAEEKADDISEKELDELEEELDETPEEETVKTEYHKMVGSYTKEKPDISTYIPDNASTKANVNANDGEKGDKPYIIRPEQFGEDHDYEQISLTLYSDGILADDDDSIMEDVDKTIGADSLNHFGEYEDDSVYVRNEKLMCEYEILLDNRKYSEVLEEKPYLRKGVL